MKWGNEVNSSLEQCLFRVLIYQIYGSTKNKNLKWYLRKNYTFMGSFFSVCTTSGAKDNYN